jgi:hypothetical protein
VCGFTRPLESELGELGYSEIEKSEPVSVAGNDWRLWIIAFSGQMGPLYLIALVSMEIFKRAKCLLGPLY